jgi:hypothetical protein
MVKQQLALAWSVEEQQAGERLRDAWEEYFSTRAEQAGEIPGRLPMHPEDARIAEVRARHEAELLRYPNVVGLATGMRMRRGAPTDEPCLVVYVERKLPPDQLAAGEQLPAELDGVPIDVVETGRVQPLSG